ncbi:hypothetical protein MTO96_001881 [Rhipicephalus appendiculatus]
MDRRLFPGNGAALPVERIRGKAKLFARNCKPGTPPRLRYNAAVAASTSAYAAEPLLPPTAAAATATSGRHASGFRIGRAPSGSPLERKSFR